MKVHSTFTGSKSKKHLIAFSCATALAGFAFIAKPAFAEEAKADNASNLDVTAATTANVETTADLVETKVVEAPATTEKVASTESTTNDSEQATTSVASSETTSETASTTVSESQAPSESASSLEEESEEDSNKEVMLLVEDNQELRTFLRTIFSPVYRVIEAVDGMDGWSKALKFVPDIIISDVMMPEKDGIEMTKELRADMTTSHIPIVLLTAKTSIESKLEGLEYGADDYITKPFSATYLKARVENLLAQRHKLQSFYRDNLMNSVLSSTAVSEEVVLEEEKLPEMSPNDRKFMDKLIELMEKNMDNGDLVVDDLVREVAVSRSVFFKKLKTLTGLAPIEFIKEMRINRAAQLIETGEFNMTQISYMVGINDPRYFSKCFKSKIGMTPTEYKDSLSKKNT